MIDLRRIGPGSAFFLICAFCIIWPAAAQAKSTPIDDSGTQALEPSVNMHWRSAAPPRSGADNLMIGTTTIRLHLNVMPWLHRRGRIYLSLPAQPPGPIGASWTAQQRLYSGQIRSGGRVLLYDGPFTTPFLEDVLKFQFTVDAALTRRPFPVNFQFEMDED